MRLSPKQYAEKIGVHPDTVYRWIGEGLPHYRVGRRGRIRIDENEANEWMRKQ